ncbi:MAG: DNA primase [Alphaproteobacteria bacterium]
MAFPPSFVEELRARLPVSQVVGKKVKLTRKGKEHSGLCPFHGEKTPSFTVNDDKGFYHCFGCGAHGSGIDFLMQTENLKFPEAVEALANQAGMQVPQMTPEARAFQQKATGLRELVEAASGFFERQLAGSNGDAAKEYLKGRGISGQTAKKFRLGYSPTSNNAIQTYLRAEGFSQDDILLAGLARKPDDGRPAYDFFRDRLMFSICDRQDRPVAFGGRILGDGNPKYLNSPDTPLFDKGATLFGISFARPAALSKGRLIVTEGYMDVIALAQAGIAESVAPLGTAVTERHIQQLWRSVDEPTFCFDGDAAGQKAMFRAAERALPVIKAGQSLKFAILPKGEDPDSLVRQHGVQAMNKVLNAARPLSDVLFDIGCGGKLPKTADELAVARQSLRNLTSKMEDADVKISYDAMFRERLSSYFYKPRGNGKKTGSRSGGFSSSSFGAQKLASNDPSLWQNRRRFELLLVGLLSHTNLIEAHLEALGEIEIPYDDLDQLRSALLEAAFGNESLDIQAVECHLSRTQSLTGFWHDLRKKADSFPEKWVRSSATSKEAEHGLVSLINLLNKP